MPGTMEEAITQILLHHVPDDEAPHWANERKCAGCENHFVHLYIEGFARHQAKLIVQEVRNRLGCR